jgi:hypothetical protein
MGLGSRFELPPGRKFRSPILEHDLVFMTDGGKTMITQDEIGNAYVRVGGPCGNDQPCHPRNAHGYNAAPDTARRSQQAIVPRTPGTTIVLPRARPTPLPRSST